MRFIRICNLSDWCLQVIVDNLDLFIHNETIPRKHIDFLFRRYSEKLYCRYSRLNTITEEAALWFLNPHNKTVTLSYLSENIITRLQVVGSGIISLTLYESLASERMLNSIVCCIPHVKYLDLSSSYCSDSTLLCIQRMCPDLVTLNLRGCASVTDCGMEYLCGIQSLKGLDILQCSVDYNGLFQVLQGIPSLEHLEFEHLSDALYYIHEDDLKANTCESINYNLTEFVYKDAFFSIDPLPIVWAWTVLCPYVKKVIFEFPVRNEVLDMCTRFQNLEEIIVERSFTQDPYIITPRLLTTNSLKKLCLASVEIPIITLLEYLKALTTLKLKNVSFSDFEPGDIKIQETKLQTLAIKGVHMQSPTSYEATRDKVISYKAVTLLISLSKNVTKLYLQYINAMPQEFFYNITNSMKNLSFVDMSFSELRLHNIKCFFSMPSLRIIYCDLCRGFQLEDAFNRTLSDSFCTLSWRISNDEIDDNYDMNSDVNFRVILLF